MDKRANCQRVLWAKTKVIQAESKLEHEPESRGKQNKDTGYNNMFSTQEGEVDKSKLREKSGGFECPAEIQKSNQVRMP